MRFWDWNRHNMRATYEKAIVRLNTLKLQGTPFEELREKVELIEPEITKDQASKLRFLVYSWEEYFYLTGRLHS